MCVKCTVDSGHSGAMAQFLAHEQVGWQKTIEELYSTHPNNGTPVYTLTEVEKQAVVDLSQRMCDWATKMYEWVKDGNDTLRPIAIAHSYPNKP